MAKGITDSQHYATIAAAIRTKNGESTTYKPSQMPAAILALVAGVGGGGEVKKVFSVNIYENTGEFSITYEDGSIVTGNATFDENGLPTSLTDDNGSTMNFTDGYPTSAKDGEGNSVLILWG
jgi:hypothetical protein